MFVLTLVLVIFLSVALVISATGKLTASEQVVPMLRQVGVKDNQIPVLAIIEIVGALGLLIGLGVEWLGILAAVGVVLYFGGAVGAHLRVNDTKGVIPAAVLLVVSLFTLLFRIVSA